MGSAQSASNITKQVFNQHVKTAGGINYAINDTLTLNIKGDFLCLLGTTIRTVTKTSGKFIRKISTNDTSIIADNLIKEINTNNPNIVDEVNKLIGSKYYTTPAQIVSDIKNSFKNISVDNVNVDVVVNKVDTQDFNITIGEGTVVFASGGCDISQFDISNVYVSILITTMASDISNNHKNSSGIRKLAAVIQSASKLIGKKMTTTQTIEEVFLVIAGLLVVGLLVAVPVIFVTTGEKTRQTLKFNAIQ